MTDFDPLKAQRETISGLSDVHRVIAARARDAERTLAEAEAEHDLLAKLAAFVTGLLDDARAKMRAMETAQEQQGGNTNG